MSGKVDSNTALKLYIVRVSPCCRIVWLYALQVSRASSVENIVDSVAFRFVNRRAIVKILFTSKEKQAKFLH